MKDGIILFQLLITYGTITHHISTVTGSTKEILYYVSDTEYVNSTNTNNGDLWDWTTELPDSYSDSQKEVIASDVKENFIKSMTKWNNIFIYSVVPNNIVIKRKLVNIVSGTSANYNLLICPLNSSNMEIVPNANTTKIDNVGSTVYDFDEYNHWHFDKYLIKVSTLNVYNSRNSTYNRTGAHELGHVLGLADNEFCIDDVPHHHEETIMGWG